MWPWTGHNCLAVWPWPCLLLLLTCQPDAFRLLYSSRFCQSHLHCNRQITELPHSLLWTIQQLFRNWWMFNFVFSSCLKRFSLNVTFYSLYLGMGNFGFSIFLIQLMYGAIEIPAILLNMWLLEVFGRRILFIFTALSGGLCSVLTLAVSQGKPLGWVRIVWIHVFCPVGQV